MAAELRRGELAPHVGVRLALRHHAQQDIGAVVTARSATMVASLVNRLAQLI